MLAWMEVMLLLHMVLLLHVALAVLAAETSETALAAPAKISSTKRTLLVGDTWLASPNGRPPALAVVTPR